MLRHVNIFFRTVACTFLKSCFSIEYISVSKKGWFLQLHYWLQYCVLVFCTTYHKSSWKFHAIYFLKPSHFTGFSEILCYDSISRIEFSSTKAIRKSVWSSFSLSWLIEKTDKGEYKKWHTIRLWSNFILVLLFPFHNSKMAIFWWFLKNKWTAKISKLYHQLRNIFLIRAGFIYFVKITEKWLLFIVLFYGFFFFCILYMNILYPCEFHLEKRWINLASYKRFFQNKTYTSKNQ